MTFKLDRLEESVESKSGGRFGAFWTLILSIVRSRYVLVSVCFYIILLMALGGVVIGSRFVTIPQFTSLTTILHPPAPKAAMPAPAVPRKPDPSPEGGVMGNSPQEMVKLGSTPGKSLGQPITTPTLPSMFQHPDNKLPQPRIDIPDFTPALPMSNSIAYARDKRMKDVLAFQDIWFKPRGERGDSAGDEQAGAKEPGDSRIGQPGANHDLYAEFVVFQAKYQDGDWNCNGPYSAGTNNWNLSALKNFMHQVRQWSRDRLKASVVPQVLDIGTDQIFVLKPPFIYLTGHKDFRLLDREVKNLRDYVTRGGCIWADSAMAGRRSRFDVAFRREIKRVLPDREFEILRPDHELFNTYFKDVNMPAGMNSFNEPAEIINIGEEMVVLYTLNGYGHLWESRLNREGKIEWSPVNLGMRNSPHWTSVYGPHLSSPRAENAVIYRNISDQTVRDAYKFGINVVVCLLTQYDDKRKLLSANLSAANRRSGTGSR